MADLEATYVEDKRIIVITNILVNAGGVTVSYFEWIQDRQGHFWTKKRVNMRLNRMMRNAFNNVYGVSEDFRIT